MAKVSTTLVTDNFDSMDEMTVVVMFCYGVISWFGKAWPSCTRIKLVVGFEKNVTATYALVDSILLGIDIFPHECHLSVLFSCDKILFLSKLLLPFLITFLNFFCYSFILLLFNHCMFLL